MHLLTGNIKLQNYLVFDNPSAIVRIHFVSLLIGAPYLVDLRTSQLTLNNVQTLHTQQELTNNGNKS